jgi:putative endonuclease
MLFSSWCGLTPQLFCNMANHIEIGKQGELLVVDFLLNSGYEILYRNWRYRHLEIDIIAQKNKVLQIVEVKCTSSYKHGFPEQMVTKKKFKNLTEACEAFLHQNPQWKRVEFNIAAVTLLPKVDIFLLKDVYFF